MTDKPAAAASSLVIERAKEGALYYAQLWSTLQLTVMKEHGGAALAAMKTRILRRHQRLHFLEGVDKLGIDRKLPPAVIAGRYHYLSNMLGGLPMEYVEESSKKVWVRYLPPAYSWPGVSIAAVDSLVQRSMFTGWHPNNGASLGCPRLAFVVTKVYQDGEIYDEGFFEEFDRDLAEDERIQFRPVVSTPAFEPAKAPLFDTSIWPLERQARAKRNFARGFLEEGARASFERYGLFATAYYLAQSARHCAIQFFPDIQQKSGITGTSAQDFAKVFEILWQACGEEVAIEARNGKIHLRRSNRIFASGEVGREIYEALFEYVKTAAKIFNPQLRVLLLPEEIGSPMVEEWTIEDTGRRLI